MNLNFLVLNFTSTMELLRLLAALLPLLLLFFVVNTVPATASGYAHPDSSNCTWRFIEQPLSHFARGSTGTYKQRLCVYEKFWEANTGKPIFFYTGNESPVEVYVNNTGLMWNLAQKFGALIVFAEHRYFGESIPEIQGMENCMSYLSSEEALADYASVINDLRRTGGGDKSPVIAFGGSYGGMLAAWLRIVYPSSVDGAIAASAPVWGFPHDDCALDASAIVVSYAASADAGAAPLCAANLKAAYVLISDIGRTASGRAMLAEGMNLCTPLSSEVDVRRFLNYLQSPLFNLAEGSYPFPSDYITFATFDTLAPLPAWPVQRVCDSLSADFGAKIEGDERNVQFSVSMENVRINVDWDKTTNNGYSLEDVQASGAIRLAAAAAQGIQVWYNVSQSQPACIDWSSYSSEHSDFSAADTEIVNLKSISKPNRMRVLPRKSDLINKLMGERLLDEKSQTKQTTNECTVAPTDFDAGTGWTVLTCNDGINLVNWWAQGVGNDLYWPPNQPEGYSLDSLVPSSMDYCKYYNSIGLYGSPRNTDSWSNWMDTVYGGKRLSYATNIVFSNGNLDPWSPAGVLLSAAGELDPSVVPITIDMGGHHLDLMWETDEDPVSVKFAREIETKHIQNWIETAEAKMKN